MCYRSNVSLCTLDGLPHLRTPLADIVWKNEGQAIELVAAEGSMIVARILASQ